MRKRLLGRRDFIKSSVAGLGSFIYVSSNEKMLEREQKGRNFIYRTLGKTGIKVPVIGMGMLHASNPALVRAAFDAGIQHFDTTATPWVQENNLKMFGEVTKRRSRDSFIIGVKVSSPIDYLTGLYKDVTVKSFLKEFDSYLKSLDTEYVDILYHHAVSKRELAFYEPIMKAMEKVKKDGKIRFFGISTHTNVVEVIEAAADSKFYEVVMAAYTIKQKNYLRVREALAKAANAGLGVVAIKVIRGQLMAGEIGNPRASLKWALQDPNVHATVPAFDTFEDMNADLSVMEDLTLTDSEKEDLKKGASTGGLFCQGCGQCLGQCFAHLPIPDFMRAYMYAYGYRQPALAQALVVSLGLPRQVCEDCSLCPVKCLNGWNVGVKIRDIIRLRDLPSEFLV